MVNKKGVAGFEVGGWLRQAKADLETAKYNLSGNIYYASAFFSQQAVEKALKAYYIKERRELKKTHSVSSLAKDLKLPRDLLIKIVNLEEIHRVARYPGIGEKIPSEEIEEEDAVDFYNIAEEVLKWVEIKLK